MNDNLLGDQSLDLCTLVRWDTLAGDAIAQAGNSWIVVMDDDGQPLGALDAKELSESAPNRRIVYALVESPKVIADVRIPVDKLLTSPAVRSTWPNAVIVVKTKDNGERVERVLGVWAGEALLESGTSGIQRFHINDWSLPGDIAIPRVLRRCRFSRENRECSKVLTFKEKPQEMPACPDPERLGTHLFTW